MAGNHPSQRVPEVSALERLEHRLAPLESAAFETLRGGGAITEKEGAKATAAKNRMSLAQDEKSFIAAAREYQDVLREGIKRAQARLQGGAPTGGANIDALLDKYKD